MDTCHGNRSGLSFLFLVCALMLISVIILSPDTSIDSATVQIPEFELLYPPTHDEWLSSRGPEVLDTATIYALVSPTPTNDEQYMLELVNEARRDPGEFGYPSLPAVQPVFFHGGLIQVARDHTNNMLTGSPYPFFDHSSFTNCTDVGICWSGSSGCKTAPYTCSSGNCAASVCDFVETFADRVGAAYSPYTRISENIACNSTVPKMHQAWMDSSGHRTNIMHDGVREVGISFVHGGPCGAMGTEDFGNRNGINPSASNDIPLRIFSHLEMSRADSGRESGSAAAMKDPSAG